ncbi:hypothetical protein N2384_05855 [Bacillus paralicheniformis]|nr:hypothetical protein [Bacillus paralicheniformis]UWS62566.1 hypothetical protein N2384_05855 [Bacillus paralicheniformis]
MPDDQQVKVRGYRIELSEIEVRLAQLADVHDAAVTAVEDKAGNTALCAYVAPRQDDIEALKAALKDTLPDYMVPAFWVEMDELPVTANGKIDSPPSTSPRPLPPRGTWFRLVVLTVPARPSLPPSWRARRSPTFVSRASRGRPSVAVPSTRTVAPSRTTTCSTGFATFSVPWA